MTADLASVSCGLSFSLGGLLGGAKPDNGLFKKFLSDSAETLVEAAGWIAAGSASGQSGLGWYALPESPTGDVLKTAEWLKGHDAIIHVGIGGSALGNLMLNKALLPEYFNELPRSERGPRFYLADNPDPTKTRAIWERARGGSVALIGVSKSGATAETMSQFLWFRDRLEEEFGAGNATEHLLVITDPEKGIFREFARATGCRSLVIEPSVGGRYSVLSACGLTSAAALGIDVVALLDGAQKMKRLLAARCGVKDNPAWILAAFHRYHELAGRPMAVLMPYSSKLETFAEWFAQLWGESLGKQGKGTTPVRATGAIDQHSQLQLYAEGPDDKAYTFVNVSDPGDEIVLPPIRDASLGSLLYMSGKGMGEMLRLEAKSTASALVKAGRPVAWIDMATLDARTLGALIFFYEYTTALTGRLMRIDPFDQPGVEQGKKYTYGLMGRDGFAADAKEAGDWFTKLASLRIDM